MRRKMLIAITLIVIMLLSCIAPLLQAQAATEKTTMSFNTALYKGLKSYFQEQGISAIYNDGLHTIKMENSTIAGIEELSLKEKGISNIAGIDVFTGVKRLILSGNDLDETSNLSILNNFANLVYLDLSSNQISDVSEIEALVNRLLAIDSNAINLTGQVVKLVVDVPLGSSSDEVSVTKKLPQILQYAGIAENGNIRNKGNLKADWTRGKYYTTSRAAGYPPYIIDGNQVDWVTGTRVSPSSIPNPVTADNCEFDIKVGQEYNGVYTQYQGLIKWVISIKDTSTVSYNDNPASENILKDSIFTLYYVVHADEYEGVIFKDNNLYVAVRDQLTQGQTINSDLLSYQYTTDSDGEIYFDTCDVRISGTTATLYINGTVQYIIRNFNSAGYDGTSTIYYSNGTTRYPLQDYDVEYADTISSTGVVTRTLKVKVPHYNADSRNLYVDAYDEPFALVITDLDIVNKITSLILNDKRIADLSGLEKFVGLESNLNVSYNYIETLATIYALQLNKEANNSSLQAAFNEKKDAMATAKGKIISAKSTVDSKVEAIKNEIKAIEQVINVDYPALDSSAENYDTEVTKLVNKILDSMKKIEGDGGDNIGFIGELDKALTDPQDGLNVNLSKIYPRLAAMYNVFNKEYKLTTLLTPDLNYETEEEYEAYKEKIKNADTALSLVSAEVSRISSYESAGALSQLEKDLIVSAFGLSLSADEANPISKALNDYVNDLKDSGATRSTWTGMINKFNEINIYSQAANYCLLERMNTSAAAGACFAENYLAKKIEDFTYEGIDVETLTAIYERLTLGSTTHSYTGTLYNIFASYETGYRTCASGRANFCQGTYYNVNSISYGYSYLDATLGGSTVSYMNNISLQEVLATVGRNTTDIYFYDQLMALANKFTVVNEVSRYVVLPVLKRIDVRNNQIETLGDTLVTMTKPDGTTETTTENLATLKNLKEFYAGHNLVTGDITEETVGWSTLTSLKKLDLSYNYITDIMPLQVLKNLRYLDVSDNLLEGPVTISLKEMPKLEYMSMAGNKITDISKILLDYEMDSDGNFTDYFAREDTLTLDLSRQEIELDISDAIAYAPDTSVYEVELPPIFAQLEFIDATRTAYGTTSSKGTITAKGGYAYVPVSRLGEYVGIVKVIAANGYPEDVTTSIGIDSTCTIKYTVKNIKVDSVKIDGETTRMEAGTSRTFTATVEGENVPDTSVEWDIISEHNEATTISQEGELVVSPDETATELIIEATSNYDDGVKDTLTLEVFRRLVTEIKVSGPDSAVTGKTAEFTAVVEGTDLLDENKGLTWSVTGATSSNTKIEALEEILPLPVLDDEGNPVLDDEGNPTTYMPNGRALLTVGGDETSDTITVVATSTHDTEKSGTKTVTVNKKKVTGVTISGLTEIRTGNTETYTAEVTGEFLDDEDKAVEWTIIRPYYADEYSANTKLEEIVAVEGEEIENVGGAKLTIAQDEIVRSFTIRARSKFDGTIYGDYVVAVNKKEVTGVQITNATQAIVTGKTGEYTATVNGNYLDDKDKTVTWSIIGNTSSNTKIEKIEAVEGQEVSNVGGGKLTIAEDETATSIVVRATSDFDNTKYAEYDVVHNKKEVTRVKVYEQGVSITLDGRGKTSMFTEVVEGNYLEDGDKGITWSISGNNSASTRITDAGILIVSEDETSNSITVIATSKFDSSKNGTSVVTIIRKEVTTVEVNEQDRTVRKGRTYRYTATVNGNHLENTDKGVTWSVTGQDASGATVAVNEHTTINENGSLTVGVGETAAKLVVKATSKFDTTKSAASVATISDVGADLPEVLGYTIDSDDDIIGVSPDTASSSFKAKYVDEDGFTVKVTRNGVELGENDSVATGDMATILKEGVALATNEIVVKGDVNGDGTVNAADTKLVKSHRARLTTLTGLYFKAGDIDADGELTITDVRLILAHRARIDGYIL